MTPVALIDPEGAVLFVHDCLALCGDGETRLLPQRSFALALPPWAVTSAEPLTLVPSIDCGACSVHGFITNGAWVGA